MSSNWFNELSSQKHFTIQRNLLYGCFSIFQTLNTLITFLYTSYAIEALLLELFIILNKLEITLEKALNLLKPILPQHAFFGREPQIGPKVFITDDSSAECNALELCWPEGKDFFSNSN